MSAVSGDVDDTHHAFGDERAPNRALHLGLFVLTLGTTWLAGLSFAGFAIFDAQTWGTGEAHAGAAAYALPTMAILLTHELGHYLKGKRHGVVMSWPYFLPGLPIPGVGVIPLMGTLGAFIKMQMERTSAKALLEVGAWGPLAGFLVTLPVFFVGMALSEIEPLPVDVEPALLGDSLMIVLGEQLFHPSIPEGSDVFLHPLAMAGWTGGFLTALNLLPIGQLDGGHISYSVFGEGFNRVARILWVGLLVLGIAIFPGWLLLCGLLYLMSQEHPDLLEGPPARGKDAWLAWVSLIGVVAWVSLPWSAIGALGAVT
ncbi:MAG: site-2 protease family protein, partial [Myxococcota bacterium]